MKGYMAILKTSNTPHEALIIIQYCVVMRCRAYGNEIQRHIYPLSESSI